MADILADYFLSLFRPETLVFDILGQVFGILGMFFAISSFQCKTQKYIMILQTVSSGLFMFQFLFLRAYAGMLMNLVGMTRSLVYSFRSKYKWVSAWWVAAFFVCCCLGLGALSISVAEKNAALELLPVIGMTITTFAGRCKEAKNVRLLTLINSPFWMAYNFIARALMGGITEVFIFSSIVTGIIRLDIKRKNKISPEEANEENGK